MKYNDIPGDIGNYLRYDPENGTFTWIASPSRITRVGRVVGSINMYGYRTIDFRKGKYLAHRVAWFLAHGSMPHMQIDHKDGDRTNNRLANLRLATGSQNMANTQGHSNRKLPKGTRFDRGKWAAVITKDGKAQYLGRFNSPEEAHAAYASRADELFGEFARHNRHA